MRPRVYERLNVQLRTLRAMTDARRRGVELESLLTAMFSSEQFIVHRNITSAGGLQVDLVASRGSFTVLVEAKWRSRKAGPGDINDLLDRLESTPSAVAGVLVSMNGFTSPVRDRVRVKAKTPILLLDGDEIEACVSGDSLYDLLNAKLDHLTRKHEVFIGNKQGRWHEFSNYTTASELVLSLPGHRENRWWESRGGYYDTIFTLDLPDVDWGASEGRAVECDLDFPIEDCKTLGDLISRLEAFDWLSGESAWKFEQAAVSWNGFGTRTLLAALIEYEDRFRGRAMHHTERLIVTDDFSAGLLTLTADISAHSMRTVMRCQVSMQLSGVPLDVSGIQTLAREYRVANYPVFRPLNRASVASQPLGPRRVTRSRQHRALGYIVRSKPSSVSVNAVNSNHVGDDSWVIGVLLEDSFGRTVRKSDEWGLPGDRLGPVCASLRSHHLVEDDNVYSVLRLESARTSEATIFRLMCDW